MLANVTKESDQRMNRPASAKATHSVVQPYRPASGQPAAPGAPAPADGPAAELQQQYQAALASQAYARAYMRKGYGNAARTDSPSPADRVADVPAASSTSATDGCVDTGYGRRRGASPTAEAQASCEDEGQMGGVPMEPQAAAEYYAAIAAGHQAMMLQAQAAAEAAARGATGACEEAGADVPLSQNTTTPQSKGAAMRQGLSPISLGPCDAIDGAGFPHGPTVGAPGSPTGMPQSPIQQHQRSQSPPMVRRHDPYSPVQSTLHSPLSAAADGFPIVGGMSPLAAPFVPTMIGAAGPAALGFQGGEFALPPHPAMSNDALAFGGVPRPAMRQGTNSPDMEGSPVSFDFGFPPHVPSTKGCAPSGVAGSVAPTVGRPPVSAGNAVGAAQRPAMLHEHQHQHRQGRNQAPMMGGVSAFAAAMCGDVVVAGGAVMEKPELVDGLSPMEAEVGKGTPGKSARRSKRGGQQSADGTSPTAPVPRSQATGGRGGDSQVQGRGQGGSSASGPSVEQAVSQLPPATHAVQIQMATGRRVRCLAPRGYTTGEVVLVEGDRGFDLADVAADAITLADEAAGPEGGAAPLPSVYGGSGVMGAMGRRSSRAPAVLRPATAAELAERETLVADGRKALAVCRAAVDRMGLQLRVVDAVFQYDRQKLTFVYEAPERVDFRELLREMYGEYRCRIWLDPVTGANAPVLANATSGAAAGGSAAGGAPTAAIGGKVDEATPSRSGREHRGGKGHRAGRKH